MTTLKRFLRTPKGTLLALFIPLAALGGMAEGWQVTLAHLMVAVLAACGTELAIARFDGRPVEWPSSALLSGMIVGFVLEPTTAGVVTAATSIVATLSKHIFATQRWHVFNPAALALLISVPLFGTGQSWWGALPDLPVPCVVVLLVAGAFLVDRINKFPLVLTFLAAYFGLFTVGSFIDPVRVAEMFRTPFVQSAIFFAAFMLTDPPTSPARYAEQIWVGLVVGVTSVAAQLLGVGQTYLLVGLLVGNVALAGRRWVSQVQAPPRRQAVASRTC
ncbi:MAG: RnfABCDGE type electron transport complex subunit D [Chloroflexi bacterium]|nr:RnfABCDGE type electron transport complex subunit D [Chloroflexota bacterium]